MTRKSARGQGTWAGDSSSSPRAAPCIPGPVKGRVVEDLTKSRGRLCVSSPGASGVKKARWGAGMELLGALRLVSGLREALLPGGPQAPALPSLTQSAGPSLIAEATGRGILFPWALGSGKQGPRGQVGGPPIGARQEVGPGAALCPAVGVTLCSRVPDAHRLPSWRWVPACIPVTPRPRAELAGGGPTFPLTQTLSPFSSSSENLSF